MTRVRIGLANLRFPDSIDDGVARARAAIRDAGAAGVEIVCFPECYIPGYRGLGHVPLYATRHRRPSLRWDGDAAFEQLPLW